MEQKSRGCFSEFDYKKMFKALKETTPYNEDGGICVTKSEKRRIELTEAINKLCETERDYSLIEQIITVRKYNSIFLEACNKGDFYSISNIIRISEKKECIEHIWLVQGKHVACMNGYEEIVDLIDKTLDRLWPEKKD